MEQVRDVFIFCCMTGLAFSDVENLDPSHLIIDNDGQLWIRKKRQKTKNMCNIPVLPIANSIIEKYKSASKRTRKILPVVSNQKMNSYMKEIADLCGITKKLTIHVARHMKYSNKLYFSALQSQICR